ncbi:MAG: peptidase [Thaumarchaeota archaeon]|nr:peptidase [Nitrososphaerota archaeon]MBI3642385.1 peptidase [Nitrososphaerota archaeon]
MNLFRISILFVGLFAIGLVSYQHANAEVWIPDNEFGGYFDSNGVYTVTGAVKNTKNVAIVPTITINIKDNEKMISNSYTLSIVDAGKDIPFKIKIPQIESKNAILEKPDVNFVLAKHNATNIQVIYDSTLVKHADGHTSGVIINNDTVSAYGVKVYAVIYGKDGKFLDTGKNVETITEMKPGEKREFTMYPDPLLASKVSYYSCFALGEDPTQTVIVERGDSQFHFTYLSSAYVTDTKFDDSQNSILLTARNPWPQTSYINFMFPLQDEKEKFSVYLNSKPIDVLQSKDPDGYWHVAFDLSPQSTSSVLISGFGEQEHASLSENNFRGYLLVIIPTVAVIVSVIIWKKRTD